jgi:hypothetical protein
METEEKIYQKIQQAAANAEQKDFPGIEKIWARVEEKLETQTLQKEKHLWKKLAVAASIILVGTLIFMILPKKETQIIPENTITKIDTTKKRSSIPDSANGLVNTNPVIKKDAKQILQQQIVIQNNIVFNDTINFKSKNVVAFSTPIAMEEVSENAKINVAPNFRNDLSNSASITNSGSFAKGKRYDVNYVETNQDKEKEINENLVLIDGKLSKKSSKDIENTDYETLTELKNPLYYINGEAFSEEDLFGENPTSKYAPLSKQKIETIAVLLPEKAIPIYGEKGKNGVVIITIKK